MEENRPVDRQTASLPYLEWHTLVRVNTGKTVYVRQATVLLNLNFVSAKIADAVFCDN